MTKCLAVTSPSLLTAGKLTGVEWEIRLRIKWSRKEEEGFLRNLENVMTRVFFRSSKICGRDLMQHFCMMYNFLEKRKLSALSGRFLHVFTRVVKQRSKSVQSLVLDRRWQLFWKDNLFPVLLLGALSVLGLSSLLPSLCFTSQQEESALKRAALAQAMQKVWRENVFSFSSAFLQSHFWTWRRNNLTLVTPA